MNILVALDSFKGTMSSETAGNIVKNAIVDKDKNNSVDVVVCADGGEGFSYAMKKACNGETLTAKCHDIYYRGIEGEIVTFGNTAVIDCACASGLQKRKQIMLSSSYGTGELIKFAVDRGYTDIILGLGGSGCCDGGMGALTALGAKFYDENHNLILKPKSSDMNYIFSADFSHCIKTINFTFACDVENTFHSKNGAAYVFAPQKGANETQVSQLDDGLKRINAFFKTDLSCVKGSGAAGGLCGGLYAVYGGSIVSGFDVLSHYSNLEEKIKNADIIITGEGKTDKQTLMGKLPFKIAELCKKNNKKCVLISGTVEDVNVGDVCLSLVDSSTSLETALSDSENVLYKKVQNSLELIMD